MVGVLVVIVFVLRSQRLREDGCRLAKNASSASKHPKLRLQVRVRCHCSTSWVKYLYSSRMMGRTFLLCGRIQQSASDHCSRALTVPKGLLWSPEVDEPFHSNMRATPYCRRVSACTRAAASLFSLAPAGSVPYAPAYLRPLTSANTCPKSSQRMDFEIQDEIRYLLSFLHNCS